MSRDIFDDAADLFILEHGRNSEAARGKVADIFRGALRQQLDEATHQIEIQTSRLNAAIRTGEADTVRFVVDSLIKLSARLESIEQRLS